MYSFVSAYTCATCFCVPKERWGVLRVASFMYCSENLELKQFYFYSENSSKYVLAEDITYYITKSKMIKFQNRFPRYLVWNSVKQRSLTDQLPKFLLSNFILLKIFLTIGFGIYLHPPYGCVQRNGLPWSNKRFLSLATNITR